MPSPTEISAPQLSRLVGQPEAPSVIDVRTAEDFDADPRMIPASLSRNHLTVDAWAGAYHGRRAVVSCRRGGKLSQGVDRKSVV